eukprot:14917951-Ditylum_brightwellii.AAC.1
MPKRGKENYDPAYKFDYSWKTMFHNVNAIPKIASLDLCGNKRNWVTKIEKSQEVVSLEDMIIGEKLEKKEKEIFVKKSIMCFDNYFSDDKPAEEAGKRGFGLMFTTRHDHLPKVPAEYLCRKTQTPKA